LRYEKKVTRHTSYGQDEFIIKQEKRENRQMKGADFVEKDEKSAENQANLIRRFLQFLVFRFIECVN
jgi:hypothetical protein